MEVRLRGTPVSPGYAEGTGFLRRTVKDADVPRYQVAPADVESEHHRFDEALERSRQELVELQARVLNELGGEQSAIFSAHLAMLTDPSFAEKVMQRITKDLVNVEQALDREVRDLASLLAEVESEYLRERAQDVRDVGQRLMRQLDRGKDGYYGQLPPGSVIIARELLPSETLDLDRRNVVAIITELGGENSHSAILARSLGIPAVTGVTDATRQIHTGSHLLVNGATGFITVRPQAGTRETFVVDKKRYDRFSTITKEAVAQPCQTRDGVPVKLLANVGHHAEVEDVLRHGLDGVGLFRTEFLFLGRTRPPREGDHFHAYRLLAETLPHMPIVIRTLDLGGDKIARFIEQDFETNPHLGLRGLRFSLSRPDLFETQLRGIARARTCGDVRVLFPMVAGLEELLQAKRCVEHVADQAVLPQRPLVGAMIETPAAVFAIDEILEEVDFVSVGTNDLTQFMLATDRDAASLLDEYSLLNPPVLRAVAHVVEAARRHQRPVCVCGEAAGDPAIACLLVGLGVRELSASPARSARVRFAIRSHEAGDLRERAKAALKCRTGDEVRRLLPQVRWR